MSGPHLQTTEAVFLVLLLAVAALAALARKLRTPYPVVMVIGGLLLGLMPGLPRITLDPNMVFFVVLPPLLYVAAWNTSWQSFRYNLITITLLAVGLVAFTVSGVAVLAPLFLPGFDWRTGVILGAVVAPTDSIAATSIARRIGLPKRIVDILEGESLVNDSTGLLALQFGTAMVVYGQMPAVSTGLLRFIYICAVGLAIGLLLGRLVEWVEFRIDDGPVEIAINLFVPYAAYLAADSVRASGVLAVVAAGLYLGRKSSFFFSATVRVQAHSVWDALTFILNGLVFLIIGLQLPSVLEGIENMPVAELALSAGLFSVLLILLRLAWVFPGGFAGYLIRTRFLHQPEPWPGVRRVFVVGWTGMRGVIALAAALSLPQVLADGSPFPQRSLIVLLTFSAILVTLVLQGLTLPAVIRGVGLAGSTGPECGVDEARRLVLEAALTHIDDGRERDQPAFAGLYDDFAQHYRSRMASLQCLPGDPQVLSTREYLRSLEVSRDLLSVQRQTALRLRSEGRITDEVLREIEKELDLDAIRLSALAAERNV